MNDTQNTQLKLAYEFIEYTDKSLFLTGKAGTGKTTFLQYLKQVSVKQMITVAPTGVAAINAGGVTIHSFFQLPFTPFIPQKVNFGYNKFSSSKVKIIKSLELLIIDEVSMVRADLLDAIDSVLRKYKNKYLPFGGVQLLLIGDLHQLAPVVKDDEWNILKNYYETVFFFSSKALKQLDYENIELSHIYRQNDAAFIEILNKIRNNKIDEELLQNLNKRYIPDSLISDDGYIVLTTHNINAQNTNIEKLKKIKSKTQIFNANIKGEFPEYLYPTEEELQLKIGAQVMFVKNDSSHNKLYYNGKIGKIIGFEEDDIVVKCETDDYEIYVEKETWDNVKYIYNDKDKTISEDVIGTFVQYPLKLAWAITIHKSQGLTFEKAIIDASASFAHGQVYVALSRCKSLEGIILSSKINFGSVKMDTSIKQYSDFANQNQPNTQKLYESKIAFQKKLIFKLFDFTHIRYCLLNLYKLLLENDANLQNNVLKEIEEINNLFDNEILLIAEKFNKQLSILLQSNSEPVSNAELQSRISKASDYFYKKLENLYDFTTKLNVLSDNFEIKEKILGFNKNLQKTIFTKIELLKACVEKFETLNYIKTENNSELNFKYISNNDKAKITNNDNLLLNQLLEWRKLKADECECSVSKILPIKTLVEISTTLPVNDNMLRKIKGMGNKRIKLYGSNILQIVALFKVKQSANNV